jgi:hypothetical protein
MYSEYVVCCFSEPEDAEAFTERFARERIGEGRPVVTLKNNWAIRARCRRSKVDDVSSSRRTGAIDGQRCSLRFGLKV